MKRLFLLRHAKSSWDDPALADHERPLAKRGERDAPRIAQRLRERHPAPSLIVTSSAERALRTARIFAVELGVPAAAMVVDPALYLAAPETILAVAARQNDTELSLLLVGHNPGMTDVTNRLLPHAALDNLPTAAVIGIELACDRWASLGDARARLIHYDYPKNPGAPVVG